MRFSVNRPGSVTALRVWRGSAGGGIRTLSLWSSAGSLLAKVTVKGTTLGGWQRAALTRPVALRTGRTYVVSYYAPRGRYVSTRGYFAVTRKSGPLAAVKGGNGVYRFGGSGFPRNPTPGTNFFADLEFRTTVSSSVRRDCRAKPSRCGFPDASNTGVPPGMRLKVVRGDVHTTRNGQVINGLDIRGTLWIDHSNVVVENTRVTGSGGTSWAIWVGNHSTVTGVVIKYCTVDANGSDQGGVVSSRTSGSWTMYRCNISNGENLVRPGGNALIHDNFLHGLRSTSPTPHYDVVEVYEGSNTRLVHNTMEMTQDQTSVVNVQGDFATVSGTLIQNNLLDGGGYELNIRNLAQAVRGTRIIGNRFGDLHAWGYSVIENITTSSIIGNVRDASGANIDNQLR